MLIENWIYLATEFRIYLFFDNRNYIKIIKYQIKLIHTFV